jgi:peptidoglycan/xylan/chitin deacetylase (PgdA/CDA1 family)
VRDDVLGLALVLAIVGAACSGGGTGHETGSTTSTRPAPATAGAPRSDTTTTSSTTVGTTPSTTAGGPVSSSAAVSITRVATTRRVVALTFDAGADLGHTDAILATLRDAHIKATFGATGDWVRTNPDRARQLVADGHTFINHTQDHRSFTGHSTGTRALTSAERRAEVTSADATVFSVTGVHNRPWFRPPYGDTDAAVRRDVASVGYAYEILWTVDSLGWRGANPDAIVRRCVDGAAPGAILMFHVGVLSRDWVALPTIVSTLRAQGYEFVTVQQLLAAA